VRTLAPSELIDLCDVGDASSPVTRAMLLLEAATEVDDAGLVRDWSLGQVNTGLLRLRTLVFGRRLEVLADCPQCAAICESELDCLAMADAAPKTATGPLKLAFGGTEIAYRLPTAADLLAVTAQAPSDPTAQALLRRIVLDGGTDAESAELAGALAEAVTTADPLAQIELALTCPDCTARWTEPLHVVDLFWAELRNLTERLTFDVARLAQAFGWREADILGMSARRRQRYLEMLSP
jgi:hypothetical protein